LESKGVEFHTDEQGRVHLIAAQLSVNEEDLLIARAIPDIAEMVLQRSEIGSLQFLRHFETLSELDIRYIDNLEPSDLTELHHTKSIVNLAFDGRLLDRQGACTLSKLRSLRGIDCHYVTDECARQLAQCASITFLAIDSPTLTNEGLQHIAMMEGLEELRISCIGCSLDGNRTVRSIAQLPRLQRVLISGMIVGEDDVQFLRASRPDLEVRISFPD
jgi:hypothetical protein